ncbi:alpha/beta hydrolase [Plantibacter flavus]|uniref:alpha/beta fold hydrolase n=1 Tax=Plantibacter flavus TaxID=150123 RepID=UPI003F174A3D
MDIILVPGFWLDASSWSAVTPPLEEAGHRVRPLTLPGLESADAPRAEVTLRDHIDAVVAEIDASDGPVVLVGHSGGGAIIYGAIDARPGRVVRGIYVDSGPLADGACINDELPAAAGEVPLPDWSVFEEEDLVDLDDRLRAEFRARAIPQPQHVASDKQQLSDDVRRLQVPATVVACEFSSEMLRGLMEQGHPYVAELARLTDVEFVDLPTGHWPQFTKPAELGAVLLAAVDRD